MDNNLKEIKKEIQKLLILKNNDIIKIENIKHFFYIFKLILEYELIDDFKDELLEYSELIVNSKHNDDLIFQIGIGKILFESLRKKEIL